MPWSVRWNASRMSGTSTPNAARSSSSTALRPNSTMSGNSGCAAAELGEVAARRARLVQLHRAEVDAEDLHGVGSAIGGFVPRLGSGAAAASGCRGRRRAPACRRPGSARGCRGGARTSAACRRGRRRRAAEPAGQQHQHEQHAGAGREERPLRRQEPVDARHVDRADDRARHRAEPADDDHREHAQAGLGREVREVERALLVHEQRARDAGDEARDRERDDDGAARVDAVRLRGALVLADADEHPSGAAWCAARARRRA